MPERFPTLTLVRHGATAWTDTGQHTSRTDLPLTPSGAAQATMAGEHWRARIEAGAAPRPRFALTSPRRRARETADRVLAALAPLAVLAAAPAALQEWDYGAYEGLTSAEIRARPGGAAWTVFTAPTPGGETGAAVGARADAVLAAVRDRQRRAAADAAATAAAVHDDPCHGICFSHGHFLRVLCARWLGLPPKDGRHFQLDPGAISVLGYDHGEAEPCIKLWNWQA
ncbi:hypothetical protein CXG81DRAFT_24132 [Caulochytrium protostelioides]|uniref:Phosphoglycerate mutase-like protein n=1 Tax=Caulochytrium protostelioides TaxID=1555241 RepID=A0A4P9XCQ9_9FUNG|nr:hypothetical protein CXG81DRAFT_24132 [Caulochytrium protostelioides]|eukprot:RKP03247.1 hypothetical protein CXG81DRAFT_24132 [Caulochytrium protostelioides]